MTHARRNVRIRSKRKRGMPDEKRIWFVPYEQTVIEISTGKLRYYEPKEFLRIEADEEFEEDEETDLPESLIPSKHDRIVQLMDVEE